MSATRWFNIVLLFTLAAVALLTIAGASANDRLASAAGPATCTVPAVHLNSIRAQFDDQRGAFVIRSDSAPTGVDGGLLSILGEVRICSN